MGEKDFTQPPKIPQSLFTNNFLNHWSEEFSDMDRVTAEAWQGDLKTFATLLEAGFKNDEGLDRSAKLLLKLFSISHKTHQTDKWLDLIPLIRGKIDTDRLNREVRIRLLNRLGQTYRLNNRTEEAAEFYNRALEICKEGATQNNFCLADTYFHMAEYLNETHQPAKALEYNTALMQLSEFSDFPVSFQATAQNSAGLIYRALDRTSEALQFFQSAADIWEAEGDDIEQIRSLLNIGFSLLKLDRIEEARRIFEETLQLSGPYPYKKIIVLNNLGILNFNENNYQKAIVNWKKGIQAAATLEQPPRVLHEILHNLGFVNQTLKAYPAAISYFDRAISAAQGQNDNFEVARSLGGKAEAYMEWGKFEKSVYFYDRAIGLLGNVAPDNWLLAELQDGQQKARQMKATVAHPEG